MLLPNRGSSYHHGVQHVVPSARIIRPSVVLLPWIDHPCSKRSTAGSKHNFGYGLSGVGTSCTGFLVLVNMYGHGHGTFPETGFIQVGGNVTIQALPDQPPWWLS